MAVNSDRNVRRNFTVPADIYARLQRLAADMTAAGPGTVAVSDLMVEGAKKVLADREKPIDAGDTTVV